jgi:tetratricopeptide (TPR) repeat protein
VLLKWLGARRAAEAGVALADQFPPAPTPVSHSPGKQERQRKAHSEALHSFLQRAVQDASRLRLNFIKRAWLANSFRWRLVENGVDAETANEWTRTLVLELEAKKKDSPAPSAEPPIAQTNGPAVGKARELSALADDYYTRGEYAQAVTHLEQLTELKPQDAVALNKLGAALIKVGRFLEAEDAFRKAIRRRADYAEAHGNLGAVYLARGLFLEAEGSLRRALKEKPADLPYRCNLGLALLHLGRFDVAKEQFERVLRVAPRRVEALVGKGRIAAMEGRFEQARAAFESALEVEPTLPAAWAALPALRTMSGSDSGWLARAEQIIAAGVASEEEATLRFAMGKYCDDVREFDRAFKHYQRANELRKSLATGYDREATARFCDDLIRVHTKEALASAAGGASVSARPVFVVGMMRSGTSLVEQIIASHPQATGAGELSFWNDAVRKHEALVRGAPLGEALKKQLAGQYLSLLQQHSTDALRVVDKAPVNSEFLGLIYSVFPNARIIYMRRNPIDTCLSCYFQPLSPTLTYTMDLSDLAHRYREHRRLMDHWRAVLPANTILEVPYAELVSNQKEWTRRILDFIGLEWDPRCLDFHATQRPVMTASYWQVRQRIYNDSVERWRHYRKFIGPLLDLEE